MKNIYIITLSVLALLASSCQKMEIIEDDDVNNNVSGTIYTATMEQLGNDTRSMVTDEGKFFWNDGDPISIVAKKNGEYEVYNTVLSVAESNQTIATFILPEEYSEPSYAVYPQILKEGEYNHTHNSSVLDVTLPCVYDNYDGSVNPVMLLDFPDSDEGNTNALIFRHVTGVLSVTLNDIPAGCDRFVFESYTQNVTGSMTLNMDKDLKSDYDNVSNIVTFKYDALSETKTMTFYIPLPAGRYSGFSVTLYEGPDLLFMKSTLKTQSISRRDLAILPSIEYHEKVKLTGLSEDGTANSYIVSSSGSYSFNAIKGNSIEPVEAIAEAVVLWESFGTDETPSVGDLIGNVSYSDGIISFDATDRKGNAVIAAKDKDGDILWSWHIWLTDRPKDQVYVNNAGVMMDRNLGATSSVPGGMETWGLLYQWGRKDPFLGNRSSTLAEWPFFDLYHSYFDSLGDFVVDIHPILYSVQNPTTFTYGSDVSPLTKMDWSLFDSASSINRWNSTKTIYDPCPVGYRVPDGGEKGVFAIAYGVPLDEFDVIDLPVPYDSANDGFDLGKKEDTPEWSWRLSDEQVCWYPLVPCVIHGEPVYTDDWYDVYEDTASSYWSCSGYNDVTNSYSFVFETIGNNNALYPVSGQWNIVACPVRCLKE